MQPQHLSNLCEASLVRPNMRRLPCLYSTATPAVRTQVLETTSNVIQISTPTPTVYSSIHTYTTLHYLHCPVHQGLPLPAAEPVLLADCHSWLHCAGLSSLTVVAVQYSVSNKYTVIYTGRLYYTHIVVQSYISATAEQQLHCALMPAQHRLGQGRRGIHLSVQWGQITELGWWR